MDKFVKLTGVAAPLPVVNIDTDMIIPKDYLKTIKRTGLGTGLFAEARYNEDGTPNPDFVLNKPAYQNATILVAGDNFGCGSSREHAPWALLDFGIRCVISTSFADIFRNNALKNGLLPIAVDADTHRALLDLVEEAPQAEVTVDLAAQALVLPGGVATTFPIDGFAKACLLQGTDELGYLLGFEAKIAAFEAQHTA